MKKAWIELDDKLFECKGFEDMIKVNLSCIRWSRCSNSGSSAEQAAGQKMSISDFRDAKVNCRLIEPSGFGGLLCTCSHVPAELALVRHL